MSPIMQRNEVNEVNERSIASLKAEKEELESALNNEKLQSVQLKQELIEAESKNTDLYKVMYFQGFQKHSCSSSLSLRSKRKHVFFLYVKLAYFM